ncbi:UDP-N-acetylmuramoyl-tripeptide--D-alanyl-D-alanine ligase [Halovulum dunhuangense]|uniref:UDP-N-acetylmuramoyl-tripeptide--D-alanyl-D-alanine ligase n=1 Tax=Halovulum dunhuangense TaxID=1505036 RepID=A0A849L153_9RHOB|nr:UDP-N-acetylmuramoyl-tripeptide--D-alanyl-D-alanine ligase [Halovulum dunhuangense]NNU80002.1 UDP-N-acetylmuramoyl-tripeptide--D-alanyl-D-alanine ligase [Halovulum dunhuangense]
MSPLWTAAEAAAATHGQRLGRDWVASGISIDTRTLQPGDLFVALRDVRDGHDFVAQAFEKGAAAALVSRRPDGVAADAPLLVVGDTLAGLRGLAARARARCRARVVAVTGSVGKTSSKEMLRTALSAQGPTHASEKSYNNHWGVPLTLARMPRATRFAVIEIGMNAPREIAPLSRLAQPHVGLITTVAPVHLAAFGTVEGIAAEKGSLAEGVVEGGRMVLPRDIATWPVVAAAARRAGLSITTFGREAGADYRLEEVHMTEAATTAKATCRGRPLMFRLDQPGQHLAGNALGVLAAVEALGADLGKAALELASWCAPEGRGARWEIALGPGGLDGSVRLIDESYNANPAAMAAAFEVFALTHPQDGLGRVSRGRRIAFLTDMLELGEDAPAMHAALADLPTMESVTLVHCAGPLMKALHHALPERRRGQWYESAAELAARVPRLVDAGDVVMCKGSNGSKASLLAEAVRNLGAARPLDGQGAD